MADDFNGTVTIKDRILMALGALEGVPKKLEKIESKQDDYTKHHSDQQLKNEQYESKIKALEDKINKTCVGDKCPLLADLKERKVFECVEANTSARLNAAAKKGYWKDKLIGMAVAVTLLVVGSMEHPQYKGGLQCTILFLS